MEWCRIADSDRWLTNQALQTIMKSIYYEPLINSDGSTSLNKLKEKFETLCDVVTDNQQGFTRMTAGARLSLPFVPAVIAFTDCCEAIMPRQLNY